MKGHKHSFLSLISQCGAVGWQQVLTCVEAVAFPGAVAAGAPRPLVGRGFGHGHHHQALDGCLGVVGPQLHKATVDDKRDAMHRDGGLSNVGGNDHLRAQAQRGPRELSGPISQIPAVGFIFPNNRTRCWEKFLKLLLQHQPPYRVRQLKDANSSCLANSS